MLEDEHEVEHNPKGYKINQRVKASCDITPHKSFIPINTSGTIFNIIRPQGGGDFHSRYIPVVFFDNGEIIECHSNCIDIVSDPDFKIAVMS